MKVLFIGSFLLLQLGFTINAQYDPGNTVDRKFVLHTEFPNGYDVSKAEIMVQPYEVVCNYVPPNPAEKELSDVESYVNWEINTKEAHWMNLLFIRDNGIVWYLAEPGDSITIYYDGSKPTFTGKGAPAWDLVYKIHKLNDSIDNFQERKNLSRSMYAPDSVQDYLDWCWFLDKKAAIILRVIEEYRPALSALAYQGIKENFLLFIEKRRLWKFNYLRLNSKFNEKNQYGLTNQDLCNIYDSTMLGQYAAWLINKLTDPAAPNPTYWWEMAKLELYRDNKRFFRNTENESRILGNRKEDPFIKQYALLKHKYKGLKREKLIAHTFSDPKGIFDAIGFSPAVDSLLQDYYRQPDFPNYKEGIKTIETKYREKYARNLAPPFFLKDKNDKYYLSDYFKGKIVILDFWFTGCEACIQMTPALKKVSDHFKNDTNVVFISISTDKDKEQWLNSLKRGIYTSGEGIQLYTNGQGRMHEILENYYVNSYPSLHMIDPSGKIITFNHYKIDPRKDNGNAMIGEITSQLAISHDGPYVYYNQPDSSTIYSFRNGNVKIDFWNPSNIPELEARTDDNLPFRFSLKRNLSIEPSEYNQPEKLFILSDIEGEFGAFKKLLVNNKIIDSQFNWTFGKGHLVFGGDMFDRGTQVTECLWLIYSLEEKAKAVGGYVHFILGNHEIMNLQGDHRYVTKKYTEIATAINKPIKILYGEKSELGRWLRTKNVMEKIGTLLVLHGGVSVPVNEMPLTIEQINLKSRACYDCDVIELTDNTQKLLLRGELSPFWYRGYYGGGTKLSTPAQVDSTLSKFGVQYIITGHSVIADTISVHSGGKIINTDTRHAEGKSEALLIIGNYFYRVNHEGTRHRLNVRLGK